MIATTKTIDHNADRHTRLGASDVATVLGISPFATRHSLWLEKTQRIEPWKGNTATRLGSRFEDAILDEAEQDLGEIKRNILFTADDLNFPFAAQLDGFIPATGENVEAKTSGMAGPVYGQWGEDGTDQVPDSYLVQVAMQQYCCGAERSHLYAYLGGEGIKKYVIPRAEWLHEKILEECEKFWELVESDIEPPIEQAPPLEILKRFKRQAGKVIVFNDSQCELVREFELARAARLAAEKSESAAKEKLIFALGDADGAELPTGGTVTYLETVRHNKAREASESTYRVLQIKSS